MIFNGAIEAAKEEGLRIATGTYKGTGKSGSSNKNKITFPFPPKFLFIEASTVSSGKVWHPACAFGIPHSGVIYEIVTWANPDIGNAYNDPYFGMVSCRLNGNTLTWSGNNENAQLNDSGQTYAWTAIG